MIDLGFCRVVNEVISYVKYVLLCIRLPNCDVLFRLEILIRN